MAVIHLNQEESVLHAFRQTIKTSLSLHLLPIISRHVHLTPVFHTYSTGALDVQKSLKGWFQNNYAKANQTLKGHKGNQLGSQDSPAKKLFWRNLSLIYAIIEYEKPWTILGHYQNCFSVVH